MCVHIYIYTRMYVYICIYKYIYICAQWYIYSIFSAHSFVDGHLGYFCVLSAMNNALMNIGADISLG